MSFKSNKPFNENFDLHLVFGDTFSFALLFDFNITGYEFEYFASQTRGGTKVIDLDQTDMTIVAGDPTSVQNSVTVKIAPDVTEDYSFDCLLHRFRWIDLTNDVRTVFTGKLQGIA